jgi:hypothetical protein
VVEPHTQADPELRCAALGATPTCRPANCVSSCRTRTATAANACPARERCATSSTAWATDADAFPRPSR